MTDAEKNLVSNTPENKSGIPERVWLGTERETVDGMETGIDMEHYIEYEGWPHGTEYVRADVAAASCAAKMEKLRARVTDMIDARDADFIGRPLLAARASGMQEALMDILSLLDAAEGKAPEGGGA